MTQKGPKFVIVVKIAKHESFWAQMASYVKIWGNVSNNLFHKVSKIYFSQIYARKLAKVILGFNLVKYVIFDENSQN